MLIKTYGSFWDPSSVNWNGKGMTNGKATLLGETKRSSKKYTIDFWDAHGIYILYFNYEPVYIGKAVSKNSTIGSRLRAHCSNHLASRWNQFSWLSITDFNTTTSKLSNPGRRTIQPKEMVDLLEAVAIFIGNPKLNKKEETIQGATKFEQVPTLSQKTLKDYFEEIKKEIRKINT